MTMQRRGSESHLSAFQRSKRALEAAQAEVASATEAIKAGEEAARKLPALRREVEIARDRFVLQEQRVASEQAEQKVEEFKAVAAELDRAETAEAIARLEHLAAELAFAKRLSLTSHQARQMCFARMRRAEGVIWKPPFRNWVELAEAWIRPATRSAAA
jgi:alanyl-tRNA synthetase